MHLFQSIKSSQTVPRNHVLLSETTSCCYESVFSDVFRNETVKSFGSENLERPTA